MDAKELKNPWHSHYIFIYLWRCFGSSAEWKQLYWKTNRINHYLRSPE